MADTICDYLHAGIKKLLAERNESIRWLAKQCGVDYSTVYRLQSGEQKLLSFRNAVKILKFMEPGNYLAVLSDFYPFETRELGQSGQDKIDDLNYLIAADINLYRVLTFAVACNHTRADVKEKFGTDGVEKLEKLIKEGFIVENNGLFTDNLAGMTYPSEDTVKRVSMHHFDMIPLSTPGSLIENFRGGVTREGLIDIHNAGIEYRTRVHAALDDKKGDILVAGSLILGQVE